MGDKLVFLAVVAICSTVSCMPGHGPGKPKPPPPTSGYEKYRNQTNEENANRGKIHAMEHTVE